MGKHDFGVERVSFPWEFPFAAWSWYHSHHVEFASTITICHSNTRRDYAKYAFRRRGASVRVLLAHGAQWYFPCIGG